MATTIVGSADIITMNPAESLTGSGTFTGEEAAQRLRGFLAGVPVDQWLGEGCEGQFMPGTGGGWRKGRLRLAIEFIPDAPTTPTE